MYNFNSSNETNGNSAMVINRKIQQKRCSKKIRKQCLTLSQFFVLLGFSILCHHQHYLKSYDPFFLVDIGQNVKKPDKKKEKSQKKTNIDIGHWEAIKLLKLLIQNMLSWFLQVYTKLLVANCTSCKAESGVVTTGSRIFPNNVHKV